MERPIKKPYARQERAKLGKKALKQSGQDGPSEDVINRIIKDSVKSIKNDQDRHDTRFSIFRGEIPLPLGKEITKRAHALAVKYALRETGIFDNRTTQLVRQKMSELKALTEPSSGRKEYQILIDEFVEKKKLEIKEILGGKKFTRFKTSFDRHFDKIIRTLNKYAN